MPPVNTELVDWAKVRTEAPVTVAAESPCSLEDLLQALLVVLAGAVSASALKDLSSLIEALRAGRFIEQLQVFQAAYADALAPFRALVDAVKTNNISVPCFIFHFAAALVGLAGKVPDLAAHAPFLILTAPFRWCFAQYTEWSTARQLAEMQTRREELVAAVDAVQQRGPPVKQEDQKVGATASGASYTTGPPGGASYTTGYWLRSGSWDQ